jgi:hypothetical protein
MNDISDTIKTMIGTNEEAFQGYFDGNSKKIIVSIIQPMQTTVGVFSVCADNAIIENLTVYGEIVGYYIVGGIVSSNHGSVKGCVNYASVKDSLGWLGGIVGYNSITGIIYSCNNYGTVYGINSNCVGGIVGHNHNCVSNCINTGNVQAGLFVGGIAGHNDCEKIPTTIESCINTGIIKADTLAVGGIVGGYGDESNGKTGYISNSINSGLVVGKNIVGGIIGRCLGEIKNCTNTGVVSGNTNVGCIFGEKSKTATVTNCHFDKQMCD